MTERGGSAIAATHRTINLALARARYSARGIVSAYPNLYLPLVGLKGSSDTEHVVRVSSEIVIEGFPRSGNTFAVVAFELAQSRPVEIAHHLHAAAQLIRGAKLRRPMLVLIREPVDAVLSHLLRNQRITARQSLHDWIRFYRAAQGLRGAVVIATFNEVTTDFGGVIDRVNDRFGTSFARFEHTPDNERRCFERIEEKNRARYCRLVESTIARPSDGRRAAKDALRPRLEARGVRPLVEAADRIYTTLAARPHTTPWG
jgi:hypothetical protein